MPLNGLRIAQTYTNSPFVGADSFSPSPFPDEVTQANIQAQIDNATSVASAALDASSSAFTLASGITTDKDPDGIGPNSIYLDVTPTISGLKISWNGFDVTGNKMPADFDRVDVHVSSTGGFVPDNTTRIGRFVSAGTLYFFSNGVFTRYYVQGIAYDRYGNPSPSSNQISDQPRQVTGSDITANTITANNILAGSVSVDRLATGLLYAGVKIVVGTLTNSTSRIEIDQQTGINLISRDALGVDTPTVTLNTLSGVGTITGGTITGSTVATALSPNSRIELKGGGLGTRDQIRFFPGSGRTGEQPGIISTSWDGVRHALTFQSPYDTTTSLNPCNIQFQSSLDSSTLGVNGPTINLTAGFVRINGDLQINNQSVARGIIWQGTLQSGTFSGPTSGAEFACISLATLATIELGRKYRLRWYGKLLRSDFQNELIISRFRFRNVVGGSTAGTQIASQFNYFPTSLAPLPYTMEIVFTGAASTNTSPGNGQYVAIAVGSYDFSFTLERNSSGNTAQMQEVTPAVLTLEDIGS